MLIGRGRIAKFSADVLTQRVPSLVDGQRDGWFMVLDGWMGGWMDGDGWMDGWMPPDSPQSLLPVCAEHKESKKFC
jgi:hypothetical protein